VEKPGALAIVAITLGLASWVLGLCTAIPGVIVSKIELNAIARGDSPAAGRTLAQIGFWSSIAHLVVTVLALSLFCCLYGGIAAMVLGTGAR